MLPRTSSLKNKQQPVAKDENVRKEAQAEEDVKTVQPMGNEAANVELMEQMLKDAEECELYWDGDFLAIDLNMAALGYSERDKVKVIVLKAEEE